jgi:fucose permease
MASFHASYSLGGLAGALFGGLFAWLGVAPAPTFVAAAVPMAITAWLAGRWLLPSPDPVPPKPGTPRPEETGAAAGAHAAAHPGTAVLLLGLVGFCCLVGEGAAGNWSGVYLHDDLGTSQGFAALGFAAFSVTMTIGRFIGDRLALRLGPVRLVRGCGLLAALGLTAGLLTRHPVGGVAGFAALGAGLSCIVPQVFSAAGNADPARAGRNLARVAGLGYLGLVSGPVLIGGVAGLTGLPTALAIPALLGVGVAALAGVMGRRRGTVAG